MAVDGSLMVVEAPVELEVSGEREPDSDGDAAKALPAGLRLRPAHQRPAHSSALRGRVDRHPTNVEPLRADLEAEAAQRPAVHESEGTSVTGQVGRHRLERLSTGSGGRVQPRVIREGGLREPM